MTATRRIRHAVTGAPGTVHSDARDATPYMPGAWAYVHFDDGLSCWCPAAVLVPEEYPADSAGRPAENIVQ